MAKFWKSDQFKRLEAEWNQRLADTGFKDVEKGDSENRFLKVNSMIPLCKKDNKNIEITGLVVDTRLQYFQAIEQFAKDEKQFEDEHDRLIMLRTAEGRSIKEISEELRGTLKEGRQRGKHSRNTIRFVRRRYENKWGIRNWNPEDMISRKPRRVTK